MDALRKLAFLCIFLCLIHGLSVGLSQQQLVVNGRSVVGLTTSLVPGSSYVLATPLGEALGAKAVYDASAQTLSYDFAGRLLSLRVFDGAGAVPSSGAITVAGRSVAGQGAVLSGGNVYVPVKPIITALGGTVTYMESQQTVMAVFPRAELRTARLERQSSGVERFVLEFSGLTTYETYYNAALGTLQVRFERTDLAAAQQFTGANFQSAIVTPNAGYVDFRVTLVPDRRYDSYTSPQTNGFSLVVDIFPETSATDNAVSDASVVIDPGHGGQDVGLSFTEGSEATLTLAFSQKLAEALRARGVNSRLTRQTNAGLGAALRSQAGIGSSLFISVHAAELLKGQYNAYYLGEANSAQTFDLALRENAANALQNPDTDALRRRVLLNLVPDLSLGEAYGRGVERELAQVAGYRTNILSAAPLAVLDGAAGRGLLLEFSPQDLVDDALVEALAAALVTVLAQGGAN